MAALVTMLLWPNPQSVAGTETAPETPGAATTRVENGLGPAVTLAGAAPDVRSLAAEMRRLHVPGVSIAVLRRGRIAWAKGYGVTRTGGAAVTPDTRFQAGSISKPVTALAALRLVQQGRLSLDADVNTQLRGWTLPTPAGWHVTLRQLLNHTGGTTVHGFPGYAAGVPVPRLEDVLAGRPPANTGPIEVDTAPGKSWRYSGGGYTVVQKLIADATGRPFPRVLRDEVLAPLGMTRSSFSQPLDTRLLASAAWPHDGHGEPVVGGPHIYPELAAAGLWTTPSDLARYALGLHRSARAAPGAVLSPPLATALLTAGEGGYGLGLEVGGPAGNRSFAHGGSNEGYENFLVAYSASGDGAVVMTNAAQGNELAGEIIRSIASAYDWPTYRSIERTGIAIAPALMRHRVGEYRIPGLGSFVIAARGDGLSLSLKDGVEESLYAMDDRTYFVQSQDLLVRFDDVASSVSGRIVSGPFDLAFSGER